MKTTSLPSNPLRQASWAAFLIASFALLISAVAAPPEWHFEFTDGVPDNLVWQSEPGKSYDLFTSGDLKEWSHVEGFPTLAAGETMDYAFVPGTRGFFRIVLEGPGGYASIPGGTFMMGSPNGELGRGSNETRHEVTISAFLMKKTEGTNQELLDVLNWAEDDGKLTVSTMMV